MKTNKIKKINAACAIVLLLMVSFGFSQTPPPPANQPPPPGLPIDGGIAILIIAGATYGVKKLKDQE